MTITLEICPQVRSSIHFWTVDECMRAKVISPLYDVVITNNEGEVLFCPPHAKKHGGAKVWLQYLHRAFMLAGGRVVEEGEFFSPNGDKVKTYKISFDPA